MTARRRTMAKKRARENEPWVENYPQLNDWLKKNKARCFEQFRKGDGFLEYWGVAGRTFVVEVFADQHGWNIYTACPTSVISATLSDAESRLGLGEGS
jgi:hypothetical protein